MNKEHSEILKKIKSLEEDKQVEPTDSIQASTQLTNLEPTQEYVEDPKGQILTNFGGQILRSKLRLTLSYQPGSNPVSPHFKSV